MGVATGVGVAGALIVGVAVGDGVPGGGDIGSGTGALPAFCGSGRLLSTKSTRLSSASWIDPAWPPGNRSRLDPAAGAAAARPSSHAVAVPQPTESSAVDAPWMRSAQAPPVAATPLAYVRSPMDA